MSDLVIERVTGAALAPYVPALAALRIEIFRDFPYLYDGTLEYEERYLRQYVRSERSVIVIARDGDTVVGASTAMPLLEQAEAIPPFTAAGIDPAGVYYFGESVLRASYRGRRIGHAFFDHREAHARELGFATATFCAVERPATHPRRPAGYRPLDAFWTKRGYAKRPDLRAQFVWRDLDEATETPKSMVFWLKGLR